MLEELSFSKFGEEKGALWRRNRETKTRKNVVIALRIRIPRLRFQSVRDSALIRYVYVVVHSYAYIFSRPRLLPLSHCFDR